MTLHLPVMDTTFSVPSQRFLQKFYLFFILPQKTYINVNKNESDDSHVPLIETDSSHSKIAVLERNSIYSRDH